MTDSGDALSLFAELAELPDDAPRRRAIRDELIKMHVPLVEYLARRFSGRGEPHDDLVQVGIIGLIKAVDRFDLDRGVEFSTYATPTVIGEIKRHFRDKGWTIRVPRRLQELRSSIASARADLTQELERAPTVRELADRLKVADDEILLALEAANAYSTVSLDSRSGDDMPTVGEAIGAEDTGLSEVDDRESIRPLLRSLPDREKRLLTLRFFGNLTQSQIAAEMGISQMHVSRLLARTLAQLREHLADE